MTRPYILVEEAAKRGQDTKVFILSWIRANDSKLFRCYAL